MRKVTLTTMDPRTFQPRLPPAIERDRSRSVRISTAHDTFSNHADPLLCPRSILGRPCRTADPPRVGWFVEYEKALNRDRTRPLHLNLLKSLHGLRVLLAQNVTDIHRGRSLESATLTLCTFQDVLDGLVLIHFTTARECTMYLPLLVSGVIALRVLVLICSLLVCRPSGLFRHVESSW